MKIGTKLLVTLAILCLVVGGVGIGWTLQEFRLSKPEDIGLTPIELEKTFEADKVKSLRLNAGTTTVQFTKTTGTEVKVQMKGNVSEANKNDARLDAKLSSEGELAIDARTNKTFQIGIDLTQLLSLIGNGKIQWPTVEVSLPDKLYSLIDIQTDTGSVRLSGQQADRLNIKLGTGKIEVSDFKGKEANVQTDTGAIRLASIEAAISAKSDTGSIQLDLPSVSDDVDLRNDTGSIRVNVKETVPFRLEATTDIGSMHTNLSGLKFDVKEKSRWKAANGENGPLIRITNDIGSVNVNSLR